MVEVRRNIQYAFIQKFIANINYLTTCISLLSPTHIYATNMDKVAWTAGSRIWTIRMSNDIVTKVTE